MKAGVVSPDGALSPQRAEPGPLGESTWLTAEFHHHIIVLRSPDAMRQDSSDQPAARRELGHVLGSRGEMLALPLQKQEREPPAPALLDLRSSCVAGAPFNPNPAAPSSIHRVLARPASPPGTPAAPRGAPFPL